MQLLIFWNGSNGTPKKDCFPALGSGKKQENDGPCNMARALTFPW